MELRRASELDTAPLVSLWADIFGDPPALAAAFLRRLPALGFGWAAVEDGHVLGAAYGVDALELKGERCLYLYAVAVRPAARGQGLGAALSRAVWETGRERGALYRCTEPAEPSLFAWYHRILGTDCVLYRKRTALEGCPYQPVRPVAAAEYAARRDALLAHRVSVCHAPAALSYEEDNCRLFGGAFFAAEDGIAAAAVEAGTAVVRECIGPEPERLAAAVGAALGCERVVLLRCADAGTPFLAGDRPLPPGTVWNLAFD